MWWSVPTGASEDWNLSENVYSVAVGHSEQRRNEWGN